jgi:hypothetical protein
MARNMTRRHECAASRPYPRRSAARTLAALAAAPLLMTACGGTISHGASRDPLSVADALRHRGADPVDVRGSVLIDRRGTALLCASLAESDPPQCSGPSLLVRRLDPQRLPRPSRSGGVTWAEPVTLRGTVRKGVLTLVRQP